MKVKFTFDLAEVERKKRESSAGVSSKKAESSFSVSQLSSNYGRVEREPAYYTSFESTKGSDLSRYARQIRDENYFEQEKQLFLPKASEAPPSLSQTLNRPAQSFDDIIDTLKNSGEVFLNSHDDLDRDQAEKLLLSNG